MKEEEKINSGLATHDGGTMSKVRRKIRQMDKNFGRITSCFYRRLDVLVEKTRETNRRLADLQYHAQQPCLAAEANVEPCTKGRQRTEDAAAIRVKHEKSSSARVDDGPASSISFVMIVEPPLASD